MRLILSLGTRTFSTISLEVEENAGGSESKDYCFYDTECQDDSQSIKRNYRKVFKRTRTKKLHEAVNDVEQLSN